MFSFSADLRLVLAWKHHLSSWRALLGAVIIGLVVVFLTNQLVYVISMRSFTLYILVVAMVLMGALLLVLLLRPRLHERPEPAPAKRVPLSFHAFFLLAGTISGIYFRIPALLLVSLLIAFIGIFIHRVVSLSRPGL